MLVVIKAKREQSAPSMSIGDAWPGQTAPHLASTIDTGVSCQTLGVVVLHHRDDDIALFVSCFDIAVSLGNLFQWIASINDRSDLSRFNEFFEEHEIFSLWGCRRAYEFLAACHRSPSHASTESRRSESLKIDPFFLERSQTP